MAIEFIDLIGLLKTFGNKGIEKSRIYGKITRRLERPSNLQDGVILSETGIFVEMSVFAVNLKYYESYLRGRGVYNKDGIYMANGNVMAYIDSNSINLVQGDWYTIDGTIRFGSKNASPTYVCVFNFYKTKEGRWGISPCKVSDLDIGEWDSHSQCYAWMSESGRLNQITHPINVQKLPRFNSFMTSEPRPTDSEQNYEQPKAVSQNISYFNKESRTKLKEYNENVDKFESKLLESKTLSDNYINSIKSKYGYSDSSIDYVKYMLDGLKRNLKRKPMPQAMTGRVIIRKYLSNFKGSNSKYAGTEVGIYLSDIFPEISNYILDHNCVVSADGKAWDLCKSAFGDMELFYAGIVGIILGISYDNIVQMHLTCEDNDISLIRVFNENPYILQFISSLGYNEIERIALCFNKHNDKSLDEYRNVSMLHALISDTSNGSTVYTKDMILKSDIGVVLPKMKYDTMKINGTYLPSNIRVNIQEYILDISSAFLGYTGNFKQKGYQFIRSISNQDILVALDQYNKSGLGVVSDNLVTSNSLLNKELFVFREMYKLASRTFDYDHSLIDMYINEYEEIVGFKLEEMQRYGVHLLVNAGFIVAGGAGSGKTTVSNCIVYVLRKLEPNIDIQFAAPTGKAAKRMQEVVHKEVKTLHSKFKLGMHDESVLNKNEDDVTDFGNIAFFFDEGAMITIDLLYKVLRKIDSNNCRIFLFGDFNQLPPIGKGLPFKNLLRFMPCVFLNVTKRAAEGSNITANSNYVNEYSDAGNWHPLESGKDFFLLPCQGTQIQRVVRDLCAYYLDRVDSEFVSYISKHLGITTLPKVDGITEDDIQVVSPLAKESYSWGSHRLNKLLEPLFNMSKSDYTTFVYKLTNNMDGSAFSVNDRVIHVDKNMYSMQWYSTYKDGCFQKIYGCGICNGEVGKIVDFVRADDCDFYDEVESCPDDFSYYASLRDDSTWTGNDKWFVVVEYYDYISDRNFYILYRAEENINVQENRGIAFKGEDLSKLNLFYAGTTHKLQGSQSKIIICVLDDVNYSGFITRQMIYTMFTRGEKLVFAVGSVGNERTSMLSRARMDIASSDIMTIGELFV